MSLSLGANALRCERRLYDRLFLPHDLLKLAVKGYDNPAWLLELDRGAFHFLMGRRS